MKKLKDYKILDEVKDDGYGHPMKVVSFTIQKMNEQLKFFNCHCSTTGREYFLGTDKENCIDAKNGLVGLTDVDWIKEW